MLKRYKERVLSQDRDANNIASVVEEQDSFAEAGTAGLKINRK